MKKLLSLVLLGLVVCMSASVMGNGATVDKSEETCWDDVANNAHICEYSLSIYQFTAAGTSNVKILGKREVYNLETGELIGKYNTGLKSSANGKTVNQITIYFAEPVEGEVDPCSQKILWVQGEEKVLHDTCT